MPACSVIYMVPSSLLIQGRGKLYYYIQDTPQKLDDKAPFMGFWIAKVLTTIFHSRIPTKKPPTRTVRSRKTKEANSTIRSSLSVATNQEWICDKIIDLSHTTESPVIKTAAGSNKQNLKDYVTTCQGPQAPLDHKNRGKPVSAPLTKVLSHLHIAGKATDLANPFASGCPRMAFGGQEEDSGESVGMI